MDGDFRLDIGEIARNIETADVLSIYFPLLRKTLIIDGRSDVEEGPMIKLLPMASSVEERFRTIRKLRTRFPRPESITVVPWPKYVDSLVRLGIWDKLMQRLASGGHKGAIKDSQTVLEELRQLERQELAAVIRGDNYHTLWESKRR